MGHQSNTTKAICLVKKLAVVGQFSEQMPASLSSGSTSQAQETCHGLGVSIPRPLMIYAERQPPLVHGRHLASTEVEILGEHFSF